MSQLGPECVPYTEPPASWNSGTKVLRNLGTNKVPGANKGEVFQNLVFLQERPFRGAQNTQLSVCTSKGGRPSQALWVALSSLCQQGKRKQLSLLAIQTKGFSDELGLEEGVGEAAASSPWAILQTLDTLGLSWCSQLSPGNSLRMVVSVAPALPGISYAPALSNLDNINPPYCCPCLLDGKTEA